MACGARGANNMDNEQETRPAEIFSEGAPADLSHIEAINNLDTARLALRWALERIHSLQFMKEQAERKAIEDASARRQAEEDRADLQRVIELRGQEDSQRAAYYAKLETYLSQQLSGKLDLAALIKREARNAELEAMLHARQLQMEKEHAARREKLEAQFAQVKFDAAQEAEQKVASAKAAAQQSRQNLERGFAVKLAELTEKEVRLRAEAESLAQRQAQFEAFSREQRARLEADIKSFHDSVEDQMRFRVESAERFLASRGDAAAAVWRREKEALLQEADRWREESLAYLPRLGELQKKLVEAQDAAQQAGHETELRSRRLQSELDVLRTERSTIGEELVKLRRQRESDLGRLLDLERRCAQADEDCSRFSVMLLQEKTRVQELQTEMARREAEWRGAREAMEKEKRAVMDVAAKRLADVDALEALLLGRFKDLEDEIHQRDLAWKEREEVLRTRDRDWHVNLREWQAELSRKSHQLETLKDHLVEAIQAYKRKMAAGAEPKA
jgi:hypothetical protein